MAQAATVVMVVMQVVLRQLGGIIPAMLVLAEILLLVLKTVARV
jgi:hypothetical protein